MDVLCKIRIANSRRQISATVLVATAILGTLIASAAQAQSGEIIIIRQVDPRNAIVPGTSNNVLTVKTAPDNAFFGSVTESLRLLSDSDAALVSSGRPGNAGVDSMLRVAFDGALGTSGPAGTGRSDHSTAMAGTGTVSGSISLGMGALQNALGTIRNSVPGGK